MANVTGDSCVFSGARVGRAFLLPSITASESPRDMVLAEMVTWLPSAIVELAKTSPPPGVIVVGLLLMSGREGVGANMGGRIMAEPLVVTALDSIDRSCPDIWATLPDLYDAAPLSALPLGACSRDSVSMREDPETEDAFEGLLRSGFSSLLDDKLGKVFEGFPKPAVL